MPHSRGHHGSLLAAAFIRNAGQPVSCRDVALGQRRAFTLLELVMVLMLMAIVVAAAAPSLRGWNRGQRLDNAAEQFLSAARWARTQAISTAAPHSIEINSAAGSYRVVRTDGGANAPAAGEFGREMILPPNFLIDITRQDESGASVIEFFPNGRLTPATIFITSDWGEQVTIASTASAESFRRIRAEGGY